MDPIKKVEAQMAVESRKQIHIYYSAVSLALHREWGWGRERISKMYHETQEAWEECAKTNERSMVQMLEEETGVELRNETGKTWRDLCFMNSEHPANQQKWTKAQFLYMRIQQLKWTGTNVFACILLGLHRLYGFGPERLERVVQQAMQIREEFGYDQEALLGACLEETGVNIQTKQEEMKGCMW